MSRIQTDFLQFILFILFHFLEARECIYLLIQIIWALGISTFSTLVLTVTGLFVLCLPVGEVKLEQNLAQTLCLLDMLGNYSYLQMVPRRRPTCQAGFVYQHSRKRCPPAAGSVGFSTECSSDAPLGMDSESPITCSPSLPASSFWHQQAPPLCCRQLE